MADKITYPQPAPGVRVEEVVGIEVTDLKRHIHITPAPVVAFQIKGSMDRGYGDGARYGFTDHFYVEDIRQIDEIIVALIHAKRSALDKMEEADRG